MARTRGSQEIHAGQDVGDTLPAANPAILTTKTAAKDQGVRNLCAENRFRPEKCATDVGRAHVQEDVERGSDDQKVLKNYYDYFIFRRRRERLMDRVPGNTAKPSLVNPLTAEIFLGTRTFSLLVHRKTSNWGTYSR